MGFLTAFMSVILALNTIQVCAHDVRLNGAALHGRRMEVLVKRQNITVPTTTPAGIVIPTTTPAAGLATTTPPGILQSTTTSSPAGGLLNTVIGDLTSSSSSSALLPTTTTTTPAQVLTSSTTRSTSSAASTSSAVSKSSSSTDQTTVITTTSTSSTSQSATAAADNTKKSSSGISHTTLIVIIVVASCVGGVAAIWTIVRKTAFSPSKRFEAKLEPIDFGGNKHSSFDFPTHGRSESQLSGVGSGGDSMFKAAPPGYPASLTRSDSAQSYRAPMTEVPHLPGANPYSQPVGVNYGGPRAYTASPAPGYPAEADYGYSNLQRGASSRYPASAQPAYNYQQQQQQQFGGHW